MTRTTPVSGVKNWERTLRSLTNLLYAGNINVDEFVEIFVQIYEGEKGDEDNP